MKNRKLEGVIILLCGVICIGAGLYIYSTAHTIYPNSGSSRVQDLNWLLRNFGKTGTAILFALPGFIAVYIGLGKIGRK